MRVLFAYALVCALTTMGPSSSHADDLVDASDPKRLLNTARGWGAASLEKDESGDPLIKGRIEGNRYAILFYGCNQGQNCDSVAFVAAWSRQGVTLGEINAWNEKHRFGKAYLDEDGDPAVDMHVNLDGAVSARNWDSTLEWWSVVLKEFDEQIVSTK